MPQRIDKGEDFTIGLHQTLALLNDLNLTPDEAKKRSAACATFLKWL